MTAVSTSTRVDVDRVGRAQEWLGGQFDVIKVLNVGAHGAPGAWADLHRRMDVLSCDPLAVPATGAKEQERPVAVSVHGGTEEFNVTRDPARSSLLQPNWREVSRGPTPAAFEVVDRRSVDTMTLAELGEQGGGIDVLRLDCRGPEYQLLSSALDVVQGAACVEVTGGMVDTYVRQYPFTAVAVLLQAAGFRLVSLGVGGQETVEGDRQEPAEYRGLWFADQDAAADDIGFERSIKLLLLSKALGFPDFGRRLATAMVDRSLVPGGLAGVLPTARMWSGTWRLGVADD